MSDWRIAGDVQRVEDEARMDRFEMRDELRADELEERPSRAELEREVDR